MESGALVKKLAEDIAGKHGLPNPQRRLHQCTSSLSKQQGHRQINDILSQKSNALHMHVKIIGSEY